MANCVRGDKGGMLFCGDDSSSHTSYHSYQAKVPVSTVVARASNSVPLIDTEGEILLVKELNQMSIEERDSALEDLHGVKEPLAETEELLTSSLIKLEEEIDKIRSKAAYDKALFLSPLFVKDRDFRIMFLRADMFDPVKAAMRVVNHFEHKLRLFGLDKLVKDINLDDLDEDDLTDVLSGSLQVLPHKDRSGRTIIVSFFEKHEYKTQENHHRASWYTVMSLLEDPDSQRLGLAVVLYNVGYNSFEARNLQLLMNSRFLSKSLPMRYASCHFCYDDAKLLPLCSALQLSITPQARVRFRAHYGSHMEVLYSLSSFGLPRKKMPLDDSFAITNDAVLEYIRKRREIESRRKIISLDETNVVDYPRGIDVILGRGRPYQEYPGNINLALIVDQYRAEYRTLDRLKKTSLTHEILKMIKDSGGRFLRRADDGSGKWLEVSSEVAREKVSHAFRTKTRRSSIENQTSRKRAKLME